ncbi:hypothetical protein B738_26992, partial [Photorhabdus temperata subsp. temperata M1021]
MVCLEAKAPVPCSAVSLPSQRREPTHRVSTAVVLEPIPKGIVMLYNILERIISEGIESMTNNKWRLSDELWEKMMPLIPEHKNSASARYTSQTG